MLNINGVIETEIETESDLSVRKGFTASPKNLVVTDAFRSDTLFLYEDLNLLNCLFKKTLQHPVLEKDKEQELFSIIKNGESYEAIAEGVGHASHAIEARNQLMLHNQRLILSVARGYRGRGLPLEDLIQEGNIGLIIAIDRFDPSRNLRFSTYAIWWIRQVIQRAVRNKGTVVRRPSPTYDQYTRLQRTREQLIRFLGKEPSTDELAEASSISRGRLEKILTLMQVESYLDTEV